MSALISKQYLEELTIRLDTITRFMESQENGNGYRAEAMSIAAAMVKRACELRNTLAARKADKSLSLDELRDALSGMSLVSVVRDYDRALNDLQNAVGDQVHEYEVNTETPDSSGRDTLDALEAVHLKLHNIMRELVGAVAV
jgi:hypothetical protein